MIVLMIYMFLAPILGYLVEASHSKVLRRSFLLMMFCFAFLYASLRGKTVGIDTASWNTIFDNIARNGLEELPRNTEVEKGYMLLNLILSKIFSNSQIIIFVTSGAITFSFYKLILRYSKDYALSTLIFISTIFTITMNVTRQYFALSIVLFAIPYIFDKKFWKAVILLILASTIHYSIIIMLPITLFALSKFSLNRKMFLFIGGISFVSIPLYTILVNIFVGIFPQYVRFIESSRYSAELEVSSQYVLLFVMTAVLGFVYVNSIRLKFSGSKLLIVRTKGDSLRYDIKDLMPFLFFFLMFIEYVVVYFISRKLMIASRLIYYFQSSLVIVIPNTIWYLERKYQSRIMTNFFKTLFVAYFLYFGILYFKNDPHGIFPYVFFWD